VTVALNGDGGDEIFAGYGRHRGNAAAERFARLPRSLRTAAQQMAGNGRVARFTQAAADTRAGRYRRWAGVFSADLAHEMAAGVPNESSAQVEFAAASGLDAVDSFLAADTRFYLPTDLLVKVDITSMAHSLEVRSPLLDRDLAEYVASLPSSFKLRRLTTKYLLKKAASGLLPPATLRRPKRGFAVPISRWLRHDLREFVTDLLRPSQLASTGVLRQTGIDTLLDEHLSGAHDRAHHLWVLLMAELWYRTGAAA